LDWGYYSRRIWKKQGKFVSGQLRVDRVSPQPRCVILSKRSASKDPFSLRQCVPEVRILRLHSASLHFAQDDTDGNCREQLSAVTYSAGCRSRRR
jgi:hypothetical protein